MKENIEKVFNDILEELQLPSVDFVIEHPVDITHGDYTTNIALVTASKVSRNPREIAEEITTSMESKNIEHVDTVSVAGPGFINIRLSRNFFTEATNKIIASGDTWGSNTAYNGKVVLVEYTDPNPFKEFHIGHLFTNTVGESLARLFMMAGADVKRVNYQGDVGMHVAKAVWGLRVLRTGEEKLTPKLLGKAYAYGAQAYEGEQEKKEIQHINKAIYERSDECINAIYDEGRSVSLEYFESIYKILDTTFDHYFFESEAAPKGKKLVSENPDIFPESDGARVFDGEPHGLHTRVFLNSEGLPTYEAKELALAKMKAEVFLYDLSVISTSAEINEYFKVLKKAMSMIYPKLAEKTEHVGHGSVRLKEGKMSSRTGDVISALDFIADMKKSVVEKVASTREHAEQLPDSIASDVALAAIKFGTLKSNILQDTIFSEEQALSLEGDSGPYLQYTCARINSLVEKAEQVGVRINYEVCPEEVSGSERLMYRFPEVVMHACIERAPHHVAQYLAELAGTFNTWYAKGKIVDAADEYSGYKIAVALATGQTIRNGLWVLGIKAPEKM